MIVTFLCKKILGFVGKLNVVTNLNNSVKQLFQRKINDLVNVLALQ